MPNHAQQLSRVFQALSDPTRRAVLERLLDGPMAMSELHAPFDMALPSFAQHLSVLEECGLVRSKKEGRVRTFKAVPRALGPAETWLSRQRVQWEQRLDRLDAFLRDNEENEP